MTMTQDRRTVGPQPFRPRVFSEAEMADILARTPPETGTPEERRARLRRALESYDEDVQPTVFERLRQSR